MTQRRSVKIIIEEFRSLGRAAMATKEKWWMVSTWAPHGHIVSTVSLKPWYILFKWVNWSLKGDNNCTPIRSWTLCKEFSSFWVLTDFLNLYIDFAFLISELSLFHSSIQYGTNVLLKLFVLDDIHFKLLDDTDLKG